MSVVTGAGCVKLNNDHFVDDMTTRDAVCPSNEKLNKHAEENPAEHLKASMKEDLGKDSKEFRVDVIGGVNKKRQSDADAARIHSTLGDKNFVQNYYKVSCDSSDGYIKVEALVCCVKDWPMRRKRICTA